VIWRFSESKFRFISWKKERKYFLKIDKLFLFSTEKSFGRKRMILMNDAADEEGRKVIGNSGKNNFKVFHSSSPFGNEIEGKDGKLSFSEFLLWNFVIQIRRIVFLS
jgi:hypothetical protein